MTRDDVLLSMTESVDSLVRSGIIESGFSVSEDTVVFGVGSPLDSIGFVTFITDMEERMSAATDSDFVISLFDIDDFNENEPFLTVNRLADFLYKEASRLST